MRICHYVEFESRLGGGIATSIRQQRTALSDADIEFTTDADEGFDVLHLNVLGPKSVYQLLKAKALGNPVVYHTHVTGDDFKNSLRFSNQLAPVVDRYTRAVYNRADHLIAPSAYTKRLLESKEISTPISVVSNGIDTDRLDGFDSFSLAEEYREDEFTVVSVGFAYERKGIADFIEAGRQLPEITFRWFGPQPDGKFLANGTGEQIDSAPENVHFHGYVEDIREAFSAADAFFFPTHEENQGIALLEAAYCGLPLIIRDIPTYDGWFTPGTHCLKGESTEAFIDNLDRVRSDPTLRQQLASNAEQLAAEHTLDTVGGSLRDCYEDAFPTQY